jgi:hypothetical protein
MDVTVNGQKILNTDPIPQNVLADLEKTLESTGKLQVSTDGGNIDVNIPADSADVERGLQVTRTIFTGISLLISLAETGALLSFGKAFDLIGQQNIFVSIAIGMLIGFISQKLAERSVRNLEIKGFGRTSLLFTGKLNFINDFQISLISGRNSFFFNLLYMGFLASHRFGILPL